MDTDFSHGRASYGALLEFAQTAPLDDVCALADKTRKANLGDVVDTCSIMNAKSGKCPENCKWCAQSAHNPTGCDVYPAVSPDEAYAHALRARELGIKRFSLVTSGRALSDADVQKMAEAFRKMSAIDGLYLCGSFGLLGERHFKILFDAGMRRFHCNLETAPSFFAQLCTTHTIDDKIASIKAARKVGMSICSGGIIGMGESAAQRVELACELAELGADSIPVNILQPIKGTPLENQKPLKKDEILRTFAAFRLANPRAHIRFAAGRAEICGFQEKALHSGVSAILMGDMLTTVGAKAADDFEMLKRMGYEF